MTIDLHDLKARIDAADVYALAARTPLDHAQKLSDELGVNIWLKREDLQDVFSFKIRGAANRMAALSDAERQCGVCAASAGNHAQGMAKAAAHYGINAVIFMPITTPAIKVEAVKARGAETRLVGESYDAACDAAKAYAAESGAVFIHPFDEIDVIAGQGTIAKEILEQCPRTPSAIYICVGGGGLISGIGAYMDCNAPDTKIISVEPIGAPTLQTSLSAGQPTSLNIVDGFADGVAVKLIGTQTFDICKRVVDACILVTNDEICAAVKDIFEATRTMVEPAGALGLAGLRKQVQLAKAGKADMPVGDVVLTVSGANVNFDRIGHIVERAELGAGGEMLLAATLTETPGAFAKFVEIIGDHAVSEFNYRYADGKNDARVLVGIKLRDGENGVTLRENLAQAGIESEDLSGDSLAKNHIRHMVGGRSKNVVEQLYRFTFPERPRALMDFLTTIAGHYNISLFHYRNHGSAEAQVFCGFQAVATEVDKLESILDQTGFAYIRETDNIAYTYFLQG